MSTPDVDAQAFEEAIEDTDRYEVVYVEREKITREFLNELANNSADIKQITVGELLAYLDGRA